jgi:transcriptional regulator with XRE-family HTH domain
MDMVLKLRELRRLRRLTQVEAAASAKIGVKTLSSFETGARIDAMKVTQLLGLLGAYRMTPAEFFGGEVESELLSGVATLDANEIRLLRLWRLLRPVVREALLRRLSEITERHAVRAAVA